MAKKAQAIPKGHHSITPSLFVAGAAKAIDFYTKAFGAEELMRFPSPDGSIMHAELRIGDSIIMLSGEMADPSTRGPKAMLMRIRAAWHVSSLRPSASRSSAT